jgi:hypothetical protein
VRIPEFALDTVPFPPILAGPPRKRRVRSLTYLLNSTQIEHFPEES